MASRKEYLDHVLDQLSALDGIRSRAMMGEYLLYCQGKVIGGVYDDRLLLKPTPTALRLLRENGLEIQMERPYDGAKEMLLMDVDRRELLVTIVQAVADEMPEAKEKKRSKTR